jgi:hypothetical protein
MLFMNSPSIHKTITLLFGFLSLTEGYTQTIPDSLLVYDRGYTLPKIHKEDKESTSKLALELTANKTSDKEKFDALFHWVASTITYDFNKASKVDGNTQANLTDIVLTEKAICIDYAQLMDSLCFYAGLASVSVTGMTKGKGFSVGDPVFFDDHAWNAVRLDGEWFVYDVTWAAVSETYRYTRFSIWITGLQNKLYSKSRTKKYRITFEKQSPNAIQCEVSKEQQDSVLFTYQANIKAFEWGAQVLSYIPKRVVLRKEKEVRSFYYLTDPDLFVTDHFPSNPIWSLTNRIRTASEFSADSLYYHNVGITAYDQRRHGVKCAACDAYIEKPQLERLRTSIIQSQRATPNNYFASGEGYFEMALIFSQEDSIKLGYLPTTNMIDSTLFYIKQAEKEYRKCILASGKLFKLQYKSNVLLKKNHAVHYKKTSAEIKHTFNKLRLAALNTTRFTKNLNSSLTLFQKEVNELKKQSQKPAPTRVLKPSVEKRSYAIVEKLTRENQEIDRKINALVASSSQEAIELIKRLKTTNDTILFINKCLIFDNSYRQFFLLTDNDKLVKDNLRALNRIRSNFFQSVSVELTTQTEEFGESYKALLQLLGTRARNVNKIATLLHALQANETLDQPSFNAFIAEEIELIKTHYCQIHISLPIYTDVIKLSFRLFGNKKQTYQLLTENLKAEQIRFKARSEQIRYERKRSVNISSLNIKLIKRIVKQLRS